MGRVDLYVNPGDPQINAPPFSRPDQAATMEDTTVVISPLGNDWDDEAILSITGAFSVTPGAMVSHDGSTVTYKPPTNFHGTDTVYYDIEDDVGQPGSYASGGMIEIEVESVNDEPQVVVDQAWTGWDETITISVLNGATDADGDPLIVTDVTSAAKGYVCYDGEKVTYNPFDTFTQGTDTFTYVVKDGHGGVTSKTVTVTMVQVTGWQMEWQDSDGGWNVNPTGEAVWSHETLRWKAMYSPTSVPATTNFAWAKQDWTSFEQGGDDWTDFISFQSTNPASGTPGVGIWAIRPTILFGAFANQTDFLAQRQPAIAEKAIVAEIVTVFWDGVVPNLEDLPGDYDSDGNSDVSENLHDDNPANMGGGWRIFPDKNSIDPNAPDHREVGFVVAILPKITGIPVHLRLFDADDPTDYDGPIDDESKFSDNFGGLPDIPAQVVTLVDDPEPFGFAYAKGTMQVSTHPGDNFRLVAAPRVGDFGNLRPITSQFDANGALTHEETLGRLYRDEDGDQKWDNPNEPVLDYDHSVGGMKSSELLTVWRRLNVEVDSIKTDPNENYVWAADDSQVGSVETPDTSALADAFKPAFIDVNVITSLAFSQNDLVLAPDRFDHFAFDTLNEMINFADGNRQTIEDTYYWSAYVMGIYEYGSFIWGNVNLDARDNDGNNEFGLMGLTRLAEPEYSFIPSEIIRDVAAQNNAAWNNNNIENDLEKVKQLVVVHEIGHQFELVHDPNYPNGSLMSAPPNAVDAEEARIPEVPLTFNEADIKKMRDVIPRTDPKYV